MKILRNKVHTVLVAISNNEFDKQKEFYIFHTKVLRIAKMMM